MIKIVILIAAAYCLYRLFANDFFRKNKEMEKKEKEDTARKVECGEMVKDPECGAYVEKESSISVRNGDKVQYFCSYECRDSFLKRLENGGGSLPEQGSGKDK